MPGFTLEQETIAFLRSCLLGAMLAAGYDVFRLIRFTVRCHPVFVFFQDVCWFAAAAFATVSFVLAYHDGTLRAFILAGELLGGILWFFTAGLILMKAAKQVIQKAEQLFTAAAKKVISPFCRAFWRIEPHFDALNANFSHKMKKVTGKIRIHLKNQKKVVYNKKQSMGYEPEGGEADGCENKEGS